MFGKNTQSSLKNSTDAVTNNAKMNKKHRQTAKNIAMEKGNPNFEMHVPRSYNLKVLEDQLSPLFLRCHKKYLVNVNSIENIFTKESKIKIGGETLPIGYHYRKTFFDNLMMLK